MNTILVDARNIAQMIEPLQRALAGADFIGIDVETQDDARHDGLNARCGYDPKTRQKSKGKPLIFDHRRTELCGLSLYSENMDDAAYYLNIGHADVENRLAKPLVREVLATKKQGAFWVAHNAPFEITTLANQLDLDVSAEIVCTLQMAVSAYGPHEFDRMKWLQVGAGGIQKLVPALVEKSLTDLEVEGMKMGSELSDLVYKVLAKESDADHSYNGLIKSIAHGYGLKRVVESTFGHKMTTFEQCLNGRAHMGQLTGEETAPYGGEDAYWALRLFRHLMNYMLETGGPELVQTFFEQENPMAAVYSQVVRGGLQVNPEAIKARRESERQEFAGVLREMKEHVRALLPFEIAPSRALYDREAWYAKNWAKYRDQIVEWARSPDQEDSFEECRRVRGPVSNAWSADLGKPEPVGPNFSHYMPVRVLLYDLLGVKPLVVQGKVQSDGEARGKIKDKLPKDQTHKIGVLDALNAIAGVEQRMKLYLTPYSQLVDPETGRLYPTLNSMLATRRMAMSDPNGMQLAKRGESTYVRGFFGADYDDHVVLSCDWSAVELVEIAEFSGDPVMCAAFSNIPHDDLHSGAAADILAVDAPGLTEQHFKELRLHEKWETFAEHYGVVPFDNVALLQKNLKGEALLPQGAYKYFRTEIGKGANFNYWYSGFLATIGERMGWSMDKTSEATKRYADRFAVAEQWRIEKIAEVQRNGFITLPDHHRYVRYEATADWAMEWAQKFLPSGPTPDYLRNYAQVINWMARKIARRAGNQTVNAEIQGSCATLAKRSIIRILDKAHARGWGPREFRFMMPVHDELVFSVHRSIIVEAIALVRGTMIDHPDLFKRCKLDSSPAIGLTFEPWNVKKARLGQVELYEPPKEIVGEDLANTRLEDDGVRGVVDWLFTERERLAA